MFAYNAVLAKYYYSIARTTLLQRSDSLHCLQDLLRLGVSSKYDNCDGSAIDKGDEGFIL